MRTSAALISLMLDLRCSCPHARLAALCGARLCGVLKRLAHRDSGRERREFSALSNLQQLHIGIVKHVTGDGFAEGLVSQGQSYM